MKKEVLLLFFFLRFSVEEETKSSSSRGRCKRDVSERKSTQPTPIFVEGEAGSTLALPCDVTPPTGDRVAVILWYRDQRQEAVYTYDARNTSLAFRQHTPRDPSLHGRATFHAKTPARLLIYHSQASDSGLYQCRVDFLAAPSKTTFLKIQVVTPPERIHLEDSRGSAVEEIMSSVLGNSFFLSCSVGGGNPRPKIWWTLNENLVRSPMNSESKVITRSNLTIPRLTRSHHEMRINCHASSSNTSKNVTATTTLFLNMPPLTVNVAMEKPSVEAGHRYRVYCDVSGSYPEPIVTWSITRRGRHPEVLSEKSWLGKTDGRWWVEQIAAWSDDGAQTGCSASSPTLPHLALHNTTELSVHYAPRLKLGLGEHLVPSDILEGMDVYFICSVEANPPAYKISWFVEDKEIVSDPNEGVLVSYDDLVIQKVSRKWTGNFTCRASNVVGDTSSDKLSVTVRFAPICDNDEHTVFEGALGEEVYLPCKVLAFPTNVTFYWTFANSVTQERLSQEWVTWNGLESILRYRSESLQDYGTLHCWAVNSAGQQEIPCTLSFRPAGAPAPPSNCSVNNQTWDTLQVMCFPPKIGYKRFVSHSTGKLRDRNGGNESLPSLQFDYKSNFWTKSDDILFLLTVYERNTMDVVYNRTGENGVFTIKGLSSGLDYLITVSRFNSRGRSSEITLEALTLRAAENRMRKNFISEPKPQLMKNWYVTTVGAVIGAVLTVSAMIIAMIVLVRKKRQRRQAVGRQAKHEPIKIQTDPPDILDQKEANYISLTSPNNSKETKKMKSDHDLKMSTEINLKQSNEGSPSTRTIVPNQLQARDLQAQLQPLPQAQIPAYIAPDIHTLPRSKSGLDYSLSYQDADTSAKLPFSEEGFSTLGRQRVNKNDQKYTFVRRGDPQIERESFL